LEAYTEEQVLYFSLLLFFNKWNAFHHQCKLKNVKGVCFQLYTGLSVNALHKNYLMTCRLLQRDAQQAEN